MLELAVKTLLAYLLGSLMGALIIGALRGVDIRQQGSGNAGGTNALRTQGKAFALGVVAIDIGKGWFAAGALPGLALPGVGLDAALGREWLAVSCAAAAKFKRSFVFEYGAKSTKATLTPSSLVTPI